MLIQFCDLYEQYYGLSAVTMNLHLLRHYAFAVRNTGPLWSSSLFGFETNMGVLKKYYSGGRFVLNQIAEKYVISKSVYKNNIIDNQPQFNHADDIPFQFFRLI